MMNPLEVIASILGSTSFWIEVLVYTVIVLSLNMEYGWTGIPNFGKIAFVSMGGLAAAVTLNYIILPMLIASHPSNPEIAKHVQAIREALEKGIGPGNYYYSMLITQHVNPLFQAEPGYYALLIVISMFVAAGLGALLAFIVAYPVVRLREDYLAIVLLMASFLTWIIYTNVPPLMGGTFGIIVPSSGPLEALFGAASETAKLAIMAVAAGVSLYVAERMLNTPFGRVLRAVRDDEAAAEAMGKNVALTRLKVIIVASIWSALGGVLYTLLYMGGSIHPNNYNIEITFLWIAMMLLGGVGNNWGVVAGVIALDFISRIAMVYTHSILLALGLPGNLVSRIEGNIVNAMIGLLIVAILFLRPQGLIPEKPVRTPIWQVYAERFGRKPWFYENVVVRLGRKVVTIVAQRGKRSSRVS